MGIVNHRRTGFCIAGLVGLVLLASCAAHSTVTNGHKKPNEISALVSDSPHVTRLSEKKFAQRTSPETIELFNHSFNFLFRPDAVKDWQSHYVIGPASAPVWQYNRLSEVVIYLRSRNDTEALEKFRQIASLEGGDAVIDMHRKPIVTTSRRPALVEAYLYFGVVVRKGSERNGTGSG